MTPTDTPELKGRSDVFMRFPHTPRVQMPEPAPDADSAAWDVALFNRFVSTLTSDEKTLNDRSIGELWLLALAVRGVPDDDRTAKAAARSKFLARAKAFGVGEIVAEQSPAIRALELVAGVDPRNVKTIPNRL